MYPMRDDDDADDGATHVIFNRVFLFLCLFIIFCAIFLFIFTIILHLYSLNTVEFLTIVSQIIKKREQKKIEKQIFLESHLIACDLNQLDRHNCS